MVRGGGGCPLPTRATDPAFAGSARRASATPHEDAVHPAVSVLPEPETGTTPDRSQDYKLAFRVGDFEVDPGALAVRSGADVVRLKPKAMAVLLELARQPGITVSRDELLDRVWGSTFITPGVVGHAITALRRAFDDTRDDPVYIETIPRIGYRLLAAVEAVSPVAAADSFATIPARAVEGPDTPVPHPDTPVPQPTKAAPHPADLGVPTPESAATTRPPHRRSPYPAVVAGLLALVAVGIGGWWFHGAAASAPALQLADVRRITFDPGSENAPRLNTAGDWVVYSHTTRLGAPPELLLQSVYGTDAIPLAEAESAERPVWSPQGRRVAYVSRAEGRCAIRIAELDSPRRQDVTVCPANSLVYLDWNPGDASQLAYTAAGPGLAGGSRLRLLRERGGWAAEPFTYERADDSLDLDPRFSPNGRRIAFRRGSNPSSDLYLVAATGGAITRLTRLRSTFGGFDWLPDGSGIVFASDHAGRSALYVLQLADATLTPLDVADATSPDIAAGAWRMTYQLEDWRSALSEVPLQAGAPARAVTSSSGRDEASALSPDGRRVVFVSDRDGSSQLWSLDRASGTVQRLTQHTGVRVDLPAVSPDGERVVYATRSGGRQELWEHRFADGATYRVEAIPASLRSVVYAADGHSLWYAAWQGNETVLHACRRWAGATACKGKATLLPALQAQRARIDDVDVLLLESPSAAGGLQMVAESDLRPLRHLPLPSSHAWTVVDDVVWSLRRNDSGTGATLAQTSLRDGRTRRLADLPDLRPLGLSAFHVTPDRQHLILPTVTESGTDLAVARLARPAED